jgi:hypothetical protein
MTIDITGSSNVVRRRTDAVQSTVSLYLGTGCKVPRRMTSASYAREIVTKAVNRVQTRTLSRRTTTTIDLWSVPLAQHGAHLWRDIVTALPMPTSWTCDDHVARRP